jgi:Flp pilus assembly protein TadD
LPEDNRIARALGIFLGRTGRVEEERVILRDALKRNPQDPLLHYDLAMTFANYGTTAVTPADVTAAIEQLDAGIAAQPLGSLLLLKAALVAGCRGDLPAMRAQLDQLEKLPLAERTEDRAVFIAMWGGLLERNSRRVVAAGTLTAKNYFEDTVVPRRSKDWALALPHRLDGKENLARLDWQKAESVLRQRQREDSNNQTYPVELAATLAWLGRKDEAAREVAPIEAAWREELTPPRARTLALFYGAVGDAAKAAPYLRRAIVSSVFTTAYALRLDPWWDKLRGQPEFEALLKEPEPKI